MQSREMVWKLALIECPECGREISTRAPACIHCGCPLDFVSPDVPGKPVSAAAQPEAPRDSRSLSSPTVRPFHSLSRGLSYAVVGAFWATAGTYFLASSLLFVVVGWFYELSPMSDLDIAMVRDIDNAATGAMGLAWLAYVATGVLFIVWFFQAYKSAHSRGATQTKWGSGWTIGSWFIPFAQFIIPKLVLNEVDRMSNPVADPPPIEDRWRRIPPIESSGWWWGLFLAGIVVLGVSRSIASGDAASYEQLSAIDAVGAFLFGAAGIAGGYTVRTIGRRLSEADDTGRWHAEGAEYGSEDRADPFDGAEWIRGRDWYGSSATVVHCLSCNKDVAFPAERIRHGTHKITARKSASSD